MMLSAVCANPVSFLRSGYTGKERDTESGLDYFGARYYASSMGRWMSPDWSAKEEPVPYAKLDGPQSLNLYGYVLNNPLSNADSDGHAGCPPKCGDPTVPTEVAPPPPSFADRFLAWNIKALNHPAVQALMDVVPFLGEEGEGVGELASGARPAAGESFWQFLNRPLSESVWSMGPGPRGLAIEARLGGNLPSGFPTIDSFSNGVATSIKSLDLNASSYQSAGALSSKLTGYIDSVAGFSGGSRGGVIIKAGDITSRQLELAVSGAGTAAQQKALSAAGQYASSKGVKFTVKQVQ